MHDSGTLTDAEFADAKAKVLAENQPSVTVANNSVQKDLRRLQIQNEILSLGQRWSMDREAYLFRGKGGYSSVPTKSSGMNGALAIVALSLILVLWGTADPKGKVLIVLGVLGVFAAIWSAVYTFAKADAYEAAYEQYQQKRHNLTDQLAALSE